MGSGQRANTGSEGVGRQQGRGDPEIWGERDRRGRQGGSQPRCPQAQLQPRLPPATLRTARPSAVLHLLHLGLPAGTPEQGLTAGQGTCLEQGKDGGKAAGGHGAAMGSGSGRFLRPGRRGTQGLRHVSGARDQPHLRLCGGLRAPPVSALPPEDRPWVLLSLQGDWEPWLSSTGVRNPHPRQRPHPGGTPPLSQHPGAPCSPLGAGNSPSHRRDMGLSRPTGGSARPRGYPSRRCWWKDVTWI